MNKTVTDTELIAKSKRVESQNCFAIVFFRPTTGSNDVTVNGVPVEAGKAFAINQPPGYQDTTAYNVVFTAGAGANMLWVARIVPAK